MKVGKPKSKRVPVRLRTKIQKASAAKQKKARKEAKKNPEWRSRLKKDPGIPNLFPYKDKILHEIEDNKRRKEEDAQRRKAESRAKKDVETSNRGITMEGVVAEEVEEDGDVLLDYTEDDEMSAEENTSNPMAALLASARVRASEYDHARGDEDDNDKMDAESDVSSNSWNGVESPAENGDDFGTTPASRKDTSRKIYDKAFQQVLSASDVVLYVLDARDPLSTRSQAIERAITADPSKRLILILNKIDLIPANVLKSWLLYLRRFFPTLPLRASSSAPNARIFDHKHLTQQFTANNLIKALKNYAASSKMQRAITVGIVGYPNVGKSSVINALTSRLSGRGSSRSNKDCPVGAEAGVTTALREVKLDGKIKLIDSPGIVFPSASMDSKYDTSSSSSKRDSDEQARLILLNAIPPHEITDPVPAVSLLLQRLSTSEDLFSRLRDVYGLPALMRGGEAVRDYTTDFLIQVARKRGRLGKGGVPNLHAAAQTVVSDWRDGRIQGWVEAPATTSTSSETSGKELEISDDQKQIVTGWAKEFKIEGLWGDNGVEEVSAGTDVAMTAV